MRVGDTDLPARAEQIDVRLIDRQGINGNLDFVLLDAVRLVEQLRREGRTVPIHCVHAWLAHLASRTYSWGRLQDVLNANRPPRFDLTTTPPRGPPKPSTGAWKHDAETPSDSETSATTAGAHCFTAEHSINSSMHSKLRRAALPDIKVLLIPDDIETVKGVKAWDAIGISDYINVTACKPLILCGVHRAAHSAASPSVCSSLSSKDRTSGRGPNGRSI